MTQRYAYVVEKLPPDVATEVVDLLEEIPMEKLYDALKMPLYTARANPTKEVYMTCLII